MRLPVLISMFSLLAVPAYAKVKKADAGGDETYGIRKAAQCEIGRFAKAKPSLKIDPSRKSIGVSWSLVSEQQFDASVGASIGPSFLPPWFKAPSANAEMNGDFKRSNSGSAQYEINPAQYGACQVSKRPRDLNFVSCLHSQSDLFANDLPSAPWAPGKFACGDTIKVYVKVSAGGKITAFFFTVEPGIKYDYTRTYQVSYSDPPADLKSDTAPDDKKDKKGGQ